MSKEKLSKALTWNDIADEYDRTTGRTARIQPMDTIFNWAEKQTEKFKVEKDGRLHKILTKGE